MKFLNKILLYILLAIPLTGFSLANERNIHLPVEVMGRGGTGVAVSGNWDSMFFNPSLLGVKDYKAFSILQTGVTANWDLYEFYQIYTNYEASQDLSSLTTDQWSKLLNLNALIGLSGPLTLGYVGNGLGLLLYNDMETSMAFNQGAGLPYVNFYTIVDVGFKAGYGFELPFPLFLGKYGRFYGGFNITYLNRIKYEDSRMSIVEAMDLGMGLADFSQGVYMAQNISSDLGFLLKFQYLNIGVAVKNWLSTGFNWTEYDTAFSKVTNNGSISNTTFAPTLDLGVSFNLGKKKRSPLELSLSADLINALDFSENIFLKLRMGAEIRMLRILVARAGIYKGYPTLGVGLELPLLKVNAAYYTEELGSMPGSIGQQRVTLDIALVL